MKCRPSSKQLQNSDCSPYRKYFLATLAITVPALEVALFIYVAGFIGLWLTAGLVLVSTAIGLFLWIKWSRQIIEQQDEYRILYGKKLQKIPPDLFFVSATDCINSMIAFFCLLAPGFISDIVGLLLATPWLRKVQAERLAKKCQQLADSEGKSVQKLLSERMRK